MVRHRVLARHSRVAAGDRLSIALIKRCVRGALQAEMVGMSCEVSVLITDDWGVRGLNREFRGIDEPTDVLSFPMQEFSPPGWSNPDSDTLYPDTGLLPLGDIVLSAQKVFEQARENRQSVECETAYLTVHSVLHLLGYDHVDEAEGKKQMRKREEEILGELGVRSYLLLVTC